ncbi:MAG TPA: alpha/beta hydrolase [Verrucomicrobiae bacterium]|nr:alpha/beta hydrolase [Verrucomicrobiae bacterium]
MTLKRTAYIFFSLVTLWILAGFFATMPIVGNHPFWRTMRATPQDFSLDSEAVTFLSDDGLQLTAWFIPAKGLSQGTIILVHGIDGNRSDMLPRAWFLSLAHYSVLDIDLRAHGGSQGTYATPGYIESRDILGAVAYLRHSRGYNGPIAVFGHSYGAVAALYAAAHSPNIAAVISDSAFISFENMMKRATDLLAKDPDRSELDRLGLRLAGSRFAEWMVIPIYYLRTGIWPSSHRADVLLTIPKIGDRPILFIAGQLDEICPPANAEKMYNAALSPQRAILIVPNADHDSTYISAPHLYQDTVIHFLQNAL